jgi:hypothetical protein
VYPASFKKSDNSLFRNGAPYRGNLQGGGVKEMENTNVNHSNYSRLLHDTLAFFPERGGKVP